jgi:hypothetical protein
MTTRVFEGRRVETTRVLEVRDQCDARQGLQARGGLEER